MRKQVWIREYWCIVCYSFKIPTWESSAFSTEQQCLLRRSAKAGADALASLDLDKSQTIQTWYLAENAINGDSMGSVTGAFQLNNTADSLCLNRNPIKADGATHLGRMLLFNMSLQLLDLNNTGLLNDGVAAQRNPLILS
jgi:hypothetical protein